MKDEALYTFVSPSLSRWKRQQDREKVESLIDRKLSSSEEIHHHTDGSIVACKDHTYHMLLERRTKALIICGHANWEKCNICKEYDDPVNLQTHKGYKSFTAVHTKCLQVRSQDQVIKERKNQLNRERRRNNFILVAVNNLLFDLKEIQSE